MSRYLFEFHGKLYPSADPEEVAAALARLFQVEPQDTRPLVDGRQSFRREGINHFTASAYRQQFARIGALGEINEMPAPEQLPAEPHPQPTEPAAAESMPADSPANATPTCPKCRSSNISDEQCLACGIYLEKYYQAQARAQPPVDKQTAPGDTPEASSLELTGDDEAQAKATRWLSLAGLFLTAVFIADSYLRNVHILPGAGIDFGYWPFIIGHLFLLRACFLSAEVKGYPGSTGLLGLLSLAGLSVLLLLPDRRQQTSGISMRTLATVAVCLIVSVSWLTSFTGKRQAIEQIAQQASQLHIDRHEHPDTGLDDQTLFESEQQEMRGFLERSLITLREHNFRPNEISEAAEQIFAALARYAVWRNDQSYLYTDNQQPLPDALEENWVKADQRLFAEILEAQIDRQSQPRLFQEKTAWLSGGNPELTNPFWNKFSRYLWNVFDQFRTARQQAAWETRGSFSKASEPPEPIDLNLKELSLPGFGKTTMKVTKRTLTYSAPVGPLAETPLTLAFYLKPYKRPFGRDGVLAQAVVISPGFPQKYLYGDFNALKTYSRAYLER